MEAAAEAAQTDLATVVPPLPADVLTCICLLLPDLLDFINFSRSSRAWAAAARGVWQQKCRQRWTHGAWPSGDDPDDWWAYYKRRHQIDKQVEQLLAAAPSRDCQADSLSGIVQHLDGDAWDLVGAAARDVAPTNLGRCYWARAALFHWASRRAGARLRQLLQEAQEVPAAPAGDEASGLLAEAEDLTDLALQYVLLHHPLQDVGALRRLLLQLAEETRRRMEAQGVDIGTPEGRSAALLLLSQVLFGAQPPAQEALGPADAAAAATPAQLQAALQQQPGQPGATVNQQQQADEGQEAAGDAYDVATIPARLFGRGPWGHWMEGPDLSHVQVPPAPYGLGLRGDEEDYYNPANSLLDHVLAERRGLPITLSLLYVVVGRRVGLPLCLTATPGHVVSQLMEPTGEVYIDAFESGELLGGGPPPGTAVLTLQQTGIRMARNLEYAYHKDTITQQMLHSIWGRPALRVKGLRLRQDIVESGPAPQLKLGVVQLLVQTATAELYSVMADTLEDILQLAPQWAGQGPFSLARIRPPLLEATLRADHPQVQFHVGDVIRHRRYGYRGMIIAWTPTCSAPPDWQAAQGVANLPQGGTQPFYQVLVDLRDRPGPQTTYVAQDNILLLSERSTPAGDAPAASAGTAAAAAAAAAANAGAAGGCPGSAASCRSNDTAQGSCAPASQRDGDAAAQEAGKAPMGSSSEGSQGPHQHTPGAPTNSSAAAASGAPPSATSLDQPVHHPDVGKYMAAWNPGPYSPATREWGPGWYTPAPWLQQAFPQG